MMFRIYQATINKLVENYGVYQIELKDYGDLEDGVNVRASFEWVKDLRTVKRNLL
jgi:hypothetical protein